jgi:hypothetical protein
MLHGNVTIRLREQTCSVDEVLVRAVVEGCGSGGAEAAGKGFHEASLMSMARLIICGARWKTQENE